MYEHPPFKMAAIQAAPVYFDPKASADKACRLIKEADVVVGAVLIPGAKAPKLLTRQMLKTMKDDGDPCAVWCDLPCVYGIDPCPNAFSLDQIPPCPSPSSFALLRSLPGTL